MLRHSRSTAAIMFDVHPVGFRAMSRAVAPDFTHILPTISVPTLFIWGEEDSLGRGTRAADIGPYSLAILVCSVLFPLLAALGLWLGVRRREIGWFVRVYACATSLALLIVAVYAGSIGWIAARTWAM